MTALLDLEPGSIGPDTWRVEVGARLASSALAALPPAVAGLYDLAQVAIHAGGAVLAAQAGGSALAAVGAVGAAIAAVASAGRLLAGRLEQETAAAIDAGLELQAARLVDAADGRILAAYSTSPLPQTGRPPSDARVYTSATRSAAEVRALWTPGAVAVVPRGISRSAVWSLVPWATWRSVREGTPMEAGLWNPSETGPVLEHVEPWARGTQLERGNVRRALDRDPAAWPEAWLLQRSPVGSWEPSTGHWIATLVEAGDRLPSPPVICRRTLAPGLAPYSGPRGEPVPVAGSLLAYAAGLGGAPPPDLDLVVERVRALEVQLGPLAELSYVPALRDRLRVLAWSREHLRRAAGGAPRSWDPWPGRPDDGPARPRGVGGLAGAGSSPAVSRGAGLELAALAGLAVGALYLVRRRRR